MPFDEKPERYMELTESLSRAASFFYNKGWMYATSGNVSAVLNESPLEMVISSSGVDKGNMDASNFIIVNSQGKAISGNLKPSAETLLHLEVARSVGAKFIFHTHSIWSTILSQKYLDEGGFYMKNLEMLKALSGVSSHEHREWVPILENSQDMKLLSENVKTILKGSNNIHCFLLSGHGMYTWGNSVDATRRNVEALEFLMEVSGMSSILQKM